jgi:hypothetical protein
MARHHNQVGAHSGLDSSKVGAAEDSGGVDRRCLDRLHRRKASLDEQLKLAMEAVAETKAAQWRIGPRC